MSSLLYILPVIVTSGGAIVYLTRIKPKREMRWLEVHNSFDQPITLEVNGVPLSTRILAGKTTRLPERYRSKPFRLAARNAVTGAILYSHEFDQKAVREADDGSVIKIDVAPVPSSPRPIGRRAS